ncbi:hypothetical protein [Streptomyces sp. enrichment culture]|uniref:hypothetical protein n=1 Tax=Streptomyces sp. enrichment culture TaxID=1795815 RepID=UPI003F5647A3
MAFRKTVAALAAGAAVTMLPVLGASSAQAAPAPVQNALSCATSVSGKVGRADCTNNTNRAIAFRVKVVCGMAPDVSGNWVTLNPGARGSSSATCAWFSTGAGSASWQEG